MVTWNRRINMERVRYFLVFGSWSKGKHSWILEFVDLLECSWLRNVLPLQYVDTYDEVCLNLSWKNVNNWK